MIFALSINATQAQSPGSEKASGRSFLRAMTGGKRPNPGRQRRWFLKKSEAFNFNDLYLLKTSPVVFPTEYALLMIDRGKETIGGTESN